MGKDSKIGWTHHTFNTHWGCVEVSAECDHCYARTFANRLGHKIWGVSAPRRFFGPAHWTEPVKWDREAKAAGERRRVFCASMADVCERHRDASVQAELDGARAALASLVCATPNLDWLLLTKRPDEAPALLPPALFNNAPRYPDNVWWGTTVGTQRATWRLDALLQLEAKVRFVSYEPALEAVDFTPWLGLNCEGLPVLDWIIVGGESGPQARWFELEWARSVLRQVVGTRTRVFVKQLGRLPLMDGRRRLLLENSKGEDISEWPEDLQVRDFPLGYTGGM